eukprot:TRINITY_DN55389_c0_g1_i1.p1 TRINITY_DN55389_c0_g1~~TRINITY_DN55389_c0_g1_i1.p1  ORF type:complete len:657 (+),score=54.59 TRINITY_DN55389_c0_g1_i1:69-2039(+)
MNFDSDMDSDETDESPIASWSSIFSLALCCNIEDYDFSVIERVSSADKSQRREPGRRSLGSTSSSSSSSGSRSSSRSRSKSPDSASGEDVEEDVFHGTISEVGPPSLPQELFQAPAQALGTGGGTAAFYEVNYRKSRVPPGADEHQYVGKSVTRARDEVGFYTKLKKLAEQPGPWAALASVTMDCPGVSKLRVGRKEDLDGGEKSLLLLENLRVGFKCMRLLDVKLGEQTAVARWKGKSRFAAWRNRQVDQHTNSRHEGFRLEGVEEASRVLDERTRPTALTKTSKRRQRFALQRLRASEFLCCWLDVTTLGTGAEFHAQGAIWKTISAVEDVVVAVLGIDVPQQWIGSSIALQLEVAFLSQDPRVSVKLFDWGRAELCSAEDYGQLSRGKKREQIRFWCQYVRAILRCQWELHRIASHRFCCPVWEAFVFELHVECPKLSSLFTEDSIRAAGIHYASLDQGAGTYSYYDIPLLAPRSRFSLRCSGPPQPVGILRARVSTNAKQGLSTIEVLEFSGSAVAHISSGAKITVKLVAFEIRSEAELYQAVLHGQAPATPSLPRGCVDARSTPPGRLTWTAQHRSLEFSYRFEFLELGPAGAAAARVRLASTLPQRMPSIRKVLPSVICDTATVDTGAREYVSRRAPWVYDPALCPRHWH